VAFLYSRGAENSSWIYGHELGRNEVEERFGGIVETIALRDCNSEEKIDRAFEAAAADHDEVVFATSPDMMDAAQRAAIRYPDMKILDCSINLMSSAVRTYYPKMYEAKFIMGALAAAYAEDHRIGYVADYPLNGTIAGVNAFAIGAALVDPMVKIYLVWSGRKNSNWEKELEEERGIRVISGPDMIRPDDVSRRYGVYRIHEDGSVKRLAAPIWNWGNFYCQIIEKVLDGSWESMEKSSRAQAVNYWFGMASGSVDVILSDELPYYSEKMVSLFKTGLLSGNVRPFGGELHGNKGEKIADSDHPELTNEEIIEMNWLNDNVVGEIPAWGELIDSVQMTLTMSGIQEIK
jgi:basic membrane lipoprotein Med (substrate-binding protein (PBP1-ABC) superfamily)